MFLSPFLPFLLAAPVVLSVPVGPPGGGRPTSFPTGFPTSRPTGFPGRPTLSSSGTASPTSVEATPSPSASAACDISSATVDIPSGQTTIAQPTGKVSFVALGVGVQNYTCSAAGTYTSTGAVASIFDLSCAFGTSAFDTTQDDAMSAWSSSSGTPADVVASLSGLNNPKQLGSHFFITNPVTGSGLSPVWDFRAAAFAGNDNAFVVAAKQAGIAAPTGSQDVDWLFLAAVSGQGSLADQVYRTDTRLGQPPASCTPGSPDISVKYASKYWLLGGSVAA